MPVTLDIQGVPKAQARPRAWSNRWGLTRVYVPANDWRECVMGAVLAARANGMAQVAEPVAVRLTFRMPRTKRLPRPRRLRHGRVWCKARCASARPDPPCVGREDLDNLVKATLDEITPTGRANPRWGLLRNDNLVVRLIAEKRYARVDEQAGCLVEIEAVGGDDGSL